MKYPGEGKSGIRVFSPINLILQRLAWRCYRPNRPPMSARLIGTLCAGPVGGTHAKRGPD